MGFGETGFGEMERHRLAIEARNTGYEFFYKHL